MSAAAARRRKQLAARSQQQDVVGTQLADILATPDVDEATAYEALQLAQSQVRKKLQAGDFTGSCDMCYNTALSLLQKGRISVASQLLTLLADVLRETHTDETPEWLERLQELNKAHGEAMLTEKDNMTSPEITRLARLQRDWLLRILQWSADLGTTKYGNNVIQQMIGEHCWKLAALEKDHDEEEDDEWILELQCDAVQHLALAEQPEQLLEYLATLPAPTAEETASGHACPPALRDGLFTRAVLLMAAVENLRDAHTLVTGYMNRIEERNITELKTSYTNKEDGQAPSHIMFGCMLLRILQKDARTGPLFQWLLRSFKRELDRLPKQAVVSSFVTKIGKIYFNIQPPPNMLSMMENMMGMMGGGGGGGMNPAMMQAAMAQLQGGMM